MDRLIIIPIMLAALYFLYRYIKKSIKGEGGCHGDCARCSREFRNKVHGVPSVK